MKLARHRQFKKNFRLRVSHNPKLVKKFEQRLRLFLINRNHPLLKDHMLTGKKKGYRAFWITGDVRVVYKIEGETIRLYDIGTHPQVY